MPQFHFDNIFLESCDDDNQLICNKETGMIQKIESIYSSNKFKTILQIYMIILLLQYLTIYACVPFDEIENRPMINVMTCLYCLFMFSINACLLPICSTKVPTLTTLRCLICSLILESIAMIFNIITVVFTIKIPKMYSYEFDEKLRVTRKIDVSKYIKIINIISLMFNSMAFMFLLINVFISSSILKNIMNKINDVNLKKEKMLLNLDLELPKVLIHEQISSYLN